MIEKLCSEYDRYAKERLARKESNRGKKNKKEADHLTSLSLFWLVTLFTDLIRGSDY